jgi:hypothetical protein
MKSIVGCRRRRSYLSSYSNWTKRATSERWRVAYVPLAATTAKSANGVLISLSQSGRGMQSASVKQTMSAVAARAPTLRAAAGRPRGVVMTVAPAARARAAVSSVEPSSTTRIVTGPS